MTESWAVLVRDRRVELGKFFMHPTAAANLVATADHGRIRYCMDCADFWGLPRPVAPAGLRTGSNTTARTLFWGEVRGARCPSCDLALNSAATVIEIPVWEFIGRMLLTDDNMNSVHYLHDSLAYVITETP